MNDCIKLNPSVSFCPIKRDHDIDDEHDGIIYRNTVAGLSNL
jgi:hypothetical protein